MPRIVADGTFWGGGQPLLNHQLEIFKHAFLKQPDIGEYIALTKNFTSEDKEHKILKTLLKTGLDEIRNNNQKYRPTTQAEFLTRFIVYTRDSGKNSPLIYGKTALNLANDDLKNSIKNYQNDIGLIDEDIKNLVDMNMFYVYATKKSLASDPFYKKSSDLLIKYTKEIGNEDAGSINERLMLAKEISKLIDKNFKNYTIDNLHKHVEKNGI